MVQQGPFRVELVRADTREPFKEHISKHNKIYVEVEPDTEYFIRLQHTHPNHSMVRADFVLDGEQLGYCTNLIHGREEIHGLWSIQGKQKINQAIKFCVQESGTGLDTGKQWVGALEVTFSAAINDGVHATRDHTNKWTKGRVEGCIHTLMRKVIKSGKGELSLISSNPARKKRYSAGEQINTVTLHYCTAVGLIQAGLLPPPPFWNMARIKHPRDIFSPKMMTTSTRRCLNITPKSFIKSLENKEVGLKKVVVDFFDLVKADESDNYDDDKEADDSRKGDTDVESEDNCDEDELPVTQTDGANDQVQEEGVDKAHTSPILEEKEEHKADEQASVKGKHNDAVEDGEPSNEVKRKLDFSEKTSGLIAPDSQRRKLRVRQKK